MSTKRWACHEQRILGHQKQLSVRDLDECDPLFNCFVGKPMRRDAIVTEAPGGMPHAGTGGAKAGTWLGSGAGRSSTTG